MQQAKRKAGSEILAKLLAHDAMTVSQIAHDLHRTEKQVRSRLEQVEELLREND